MTRADECKKFRKHMLNLGLRRICFWTIFDLTIVGNISARNSSMLLMSHLRRGTYCPIEIGIEVALVGFQM